MTSVKPTSSPRFNSFLLVFACFSLFACSSAQLVLPRNFEDSLYRAQFLANIDQRQVREALVDHSQQFENWSKHPAELVHLFANVEQAPSENISWGCFNDTFSILKGLVQKQRWAIEMLDADGKLPSGILEGEFTWLGAYDECLKIQPNVTTTPPWSTQYCLVSFPFPSAVVQLFQGAVKSLNIGFCLPKSCSPQDVVALFNSGLHVMKVNNTLTEGNVYCQQQDRALSIKAIVVLAVVAVFVTVVIVASIYDIYITHFVSEFFKIEVLDPPSVNATTATDYQPLFGRQSTPVRSTLASLILCFSAYSNTKKIFEVGRSSEGALECLHGIRVLSMFWVILGHTWVFPFGVLDNLFDMLDFLKSWSFQAISNATFSVDTFFTMSGLLVTYLFLRELKKQEGQVHPSLIIMYYFRRFWRLTPPYMLFIMFYVPLIGYWGSGPVYPQQGTEVDECENTWWTNMLYINNFVKANKMCMGWSWYLSNDMQFHWVALPVLLVIAFWPLIGTVMILAFVLVHMLSTSLILHNDPKAASMLNGGGGGIQDLGNSDWFVNLYIKPYCRIGTYAVGMAAGYLLFRLNGRRYRIPILLNILGWITAAAFALSVLYGYHREYNGDPMSNELREFYWAASRIAWSLAIVWVVIACSTGNGGFVNTLLSWKAFIPLSRLTYAAYLVHPVLMLSFFYSSRILLHAGDVYMSIFFVAFVVFSYASGFLLSLVFEAPFMGMDKLFFRKWQ